MYYKSDELASEKAVEFCKERQGMSIEQLEEECDKLSSNVKKIHELLHNYVFEYPNQGFDCERVYIADRIIKHQFEGETF